MHKTCLILLVFLAQNCLGQKVFVLDTIGTSSYHFRHIPGNQPSAVAKLGMRLLNVKLLDTVKVRKGEMLKDACVRIGALAIKVDTAKVTRISFFNQKGEEGQRTIHKEKIKKQAVNSSGGNEKAFLKPEKANRNSSNRLSNHETKIATKPELLYYQSSNRTLLVYRTNSIPGVVDFPIQRLKVDYSLVQILWYNPEEDKVEFLLRMGMAALLDRKGATQNELHAMDVARAKEVGVWRYLNSTNSQLPYIIDSDPPELRNDQKDILSYKKIKIWIKEQPSQTKFCLRLVFLIVVFSLFFLIITLVSKLIDRIYRYRSVTDKMNTMNLTQNLFLSLAGSVFTAIIAKIFS